MAAIGRLLGGFIAILVGTTFIPTIASASYGARYYCNGTATTDDTCNLGYANASWHTANVTGAAATITSLVTLFYALAVMIAGVAITIGGLRDAGLM